MLPIGLQLVIVLILVIVAVRIQVSLVRDRSRDYQGILKQFRVLQGPRKESGCSAALEGSQDQRHLLTAPRLTRALNLARMYRNIGVLLQAIDCFEYNNYSQRNSAEVEAIKARMRMTRKRFLRLALLGLVIPEIGQPDERVSAAEETYSSLIIRFGLFLNRCQPWLFQTYRYCVSWQNYCANSGSPSLGDYVLRDHMQD